MLGTAAANCNGMGSVSASFLSRPRFFTRLSVFLLYQVAKLSRICFFEAPNKIVGPSEDKYTVTVDQEHD
jgi:hypothetical protein